MKKISVVLLVVLLSCDQQALELLPTDSAETISVVEGRLSFPSTASFFEAVNEVKAMSDDELNSWESKYNYSSLRRKIDTVTVDSLSLKRFPNSYQTLLNENGEVIIGDTIIWYEGNGDKHFVPNLDEAELFQIKTGEKESRIKTEYRISRSPIKQRDITRNRIFLSGADARWQMEFDKNNDGGSKRKYINELVAFWDGHYTELNVLIKLEYWGKKGCCRRTWMPAGDQREISYNFDFNAYLVWGTSYYGGTHLTYYGTKSGYYSGTAEKKIYLGSDYLIYSTASNDWNVEVSGTIYQYLTNDVSSNAWTCTGYPLW